MFAFQLFWKQTLWHFNAWKVWTMDMPLLTHCENCEVLNYFLKEKLRRFIFISEKTEDHPPPLLPGPAVDAFICIFGELNFQRHIWVNRWLTTKLPIKISALKCTLSIPLPPPFSRYKARAPLNLRKVCVKCTYSLWKTWPQTLHWLSLNVPWSWIHERTISFRFLGVILRVLSLEVSEWIS